MPSAESAADEAVKKVTDAAQATKEEAKDLLAPLKDLHLTDKLKEGLRRYNRLEEEGTPLRPYIKSARESLNEAVGSVKASIGDLQANVSKAVEGVKPDLSWASAELGNVDDFARTHRELTVGAIGLAVAIPSALGGVRKAAVNGLVAAGGAAAFFAMSDFFERQEKKGKAATPPAPPTSLSSTK